MGKKDFKSNPALNFITPPEPAPAMEQSASQVMEQVPEGYRLNPAYIEKRDQRINVLLTRSTKDSLRDLARETGRSVNDIINEALERYLRGGAQGR